MLTKLLSTSIIAGAFLIGCGGETREQSSQVAKTPHQIDMTPKSIRDDADNSGLQDHLNYMRVYNLNTRLFFTSKPGGFNGADRYPPYVRYRADLNPDLNYVFFVDTDRNSSTGYVNPWIPKGGAEILFENGVKYKYTGAPGSNEWSWEVIHRYPEGDFEKYKSFTIVHRNDLVYAMTLNQDWSFNSFLGYYNLPNYDKRVKPRNFGDLSVYEIGDDIYFRSYGSHYEEVSDKAKYFNLEFSVAGQNYYTEENILFKEDGTEVTGTGSIEHAILGHEAVVLIPKSFFEAEDLDITDENDFTLESTTIRDADWNVLFHESAH